MTQGERVFIWTAANIGLGSLCGLGVSKLIFEQPSQNELLFYCAIWGVTILWGLIGGHWAFAEPMKRYRISEEEWRGLNAQLGQYETESVEGMIEAINKVVKFHRRRRIATHTCLLFAMCTAVVAFTLAWREPVSWLTYVHVGLGVFNVLNVLLLSRIV